MKVIVAKNAGFCQGVKTAVDKALELAEKYGKIYTLGALIHNEDVVSFLQSKGAVCLSKERWGELKKGDVALIRAHGIPLSTQSELEERGVILYDATCPVVKKIHGIVKAESDEGKEIILIGDVNHDEVAGSISYAIGKSSVISEKDDIKIGENPVCIIFQTTITADKYEKVAEYVQHLQKTSEKSVGIFNTICYTTKARQEEARTLARECDTVVVLGSHTSANTKRLYQVAVKINPNTFFATSAAEAVEQVKQKGFKCISIVAGASTPSGLIQEVTKLMSELEFTNVETALKDDEVKEEATLQEQQEAASKAQSSAPVAVKEVKELTMEDVIASNRSVGYVNYKPGKRISCTVLHADANGIYVEIGGKKDGFIDKADATLDGNYNPADYKSGDSIEAIITSTPNKDYVVLSKKEVDAKLAEDAEAEKALSAGDFELTITEITKGGLRGRLGTYTVFVPASQIRIGFVKNLDEYKGKKLTVCLMPPKEKEGEEEAVQDDKPQKRSRYLFASARMVLERKKKEKEDNFWDSIHIHDIVTGKVKRFTAFGAFVSVRDFDCLAHISELSWSKISDPSTVLTIGESYDFVVLKMDRATGKISLGYKQLQKKPYEAAAEKYPVGSVIKGKVERIFPYGAFISIEPGIDGLVHVSEISHGWVKDAGEVLKVGEEVEAKIVSFEENRITLSIKQLLPPPEEAPQVETAEAEDGAETKAKRPSRSKKFEEKQAEGEEKRERRAPRRAAASDEPKEWVSGNSSASLGDLFKDLKLDLEAEEKAESAEEEKPKKATRKKKEAPVEAPVEE